MSLICSSAFANIQPDSVANYVTAIDQALFETENELVSEKWFLQRIRVRVRLELGLEIPVLAKFKIKPEVDLYFDR